MRFIRTLAAVTLITVAAATPLPARAAGAGTSAPSPPPEPYAPLVLTAAEAGEDVTLLRRTITELHPGYDRYTSAAAMTALFDDLAGDVRAGTTDLGLMRRVSEILALLRCDHTLAELPARIETHRRTHGSHLPFSFRLFDGRMYVDRTMPGETRIGRGDEILAINGHPVGAVLAETARYVPVDGWTDHAKRVRLEHSSELLGGAVDHFWPMLYGWPRQWELHVRRRAAAGVDTVTAEPVTYEEWVDVATAGRGRSANFDTSVEFRMLDGTTGYLEIGTFVNYRTPVDPATVLDPVFDTLREEGARHLVLDLRSCGGGSDDVPAVLMTYLDPTPTPPARRPPWCRAMSVGDLRPHLSTWDESVFSAPPELFRDLGNGFYELMMPAPDAGTTPPRPNVYRHPLTILTSPANASGATMFIALAKEHRRSVRTVGEPTGGGAEGPTAGTIVFLTLPHSGIRVRVPLLRSWVNVSDPEPGRGVEPDVRCAPTVDDWLDAKDVVLDAALRDGGR